MHNPLLVKTHTQTLLLKEVSGHIGLRVRKCFKGARSEL